MNKKNRRIVTAAVSYILAFALVLTNVGTVFASEEAHTENEIVEVLDDVDTEEEAVEDIVMDEAEESKEEVKAKAAEAKVDAVSSATATTDVLKDGTYSIEAKLMNLTGTAASMADQALDSAYVVVNSNKTTLYLNMVSMMGTYVSAITCGGTPAVAEAKDENGNITRFSLSVEQGTESIEVSFSAVGMPMAQSANLVLDWSSVKTVGEDNGSGTEEKKLEAGTYSVGEAAFRKSDDTSAASGVASALKNVWVVVGRDSKLTAYVEVNQGYAQGSYTVILSDFIDESGNPLRTVEKDSDENPAVVAIDLEELKEFTDFGLSYELVGARAPHAVSVALYMNLDSFTLTEDYIEPGEEEDESLEDGTYSIKAAFLKEDSDETSMANQALERAELVVKNGEIELQLTMKSIFGAYVYKIQYENDTLLARTAETGYSLATELETDADGNIVKFGIPVGYKAEIIRMITTYDVSETDTHNQKVRLSLDWSTVELAEDDGNNNGGDDNNNGGDDNNGGGDNNNTGDGDGDNGSDKKPANGTYTIDAKLLQANSDELSMAASVIEQAYIIVKDDTYTLYIDMGAMYEVYAEELEYDAGSGTYKAANKAVIDKDGNVTAFAFPVSYKSTIIPVKLSFDMMGAGSLTTQSARISLDWSTLKSVDKELDDSNKGSNNNDSNDDGTDDKNDGDGTLDKDNLKDGIYEVQVDLWNATSNQASMASDAMNKIARIQVKDGSYKMYVYTKSMTVGSITANLQRMQVENTSGGYSQASVAATSSSGTPTAFSFTMPHKNEYIKVKVDPQVEIMGNDYIDARLKISWSTLKKASDSTSLTSSPDDSNVASSSSSKSVKTGDDTDIRVLIAMILISAAFVAYYMRKRVTNMQ